MSHGLFTLPLPHGKPRSFGSARREALWFRQSIRLLSRATVLALGILAGTPGRAQDTPPNGIMRNRDAQTLIDGAVEGSEIDLDATAGDYLPFKVVGRTITIRGTGGAPARVVLAQAGPPAIAVLGGSRVDLSNAEILAGPAGMTGLYVQNSELSLTDCHLDGQFRFSIVLIQARLTLKNCTIEGGQIGVHASGSSVRLENVSFSDVAQAAVTLEGPGGTLDARRIRIGGGTGDGVVTRTGGGMVSVFDSEIETAGTPIHISGTPQTVDISENSLRSQSTERPVLWLDGDFPARISGNSIGGGVGGLLVTNGGGKERTIANNLILSGSSYGLALFGPDTGVARWNVTVDANAIFAGYDNFPMYFENLSGPVVSRNFSAGMTRPALVASGSEMMLSDNVFQTEGSDAILPTEGLDMKGNVLIWADGATIIDPAAAKIRQLTDELVWLSSTDDTFPRILQRAYDTAFEIADTAAETVGTGPFVYWIANGEAVRGPVLELRPAKDLKRVAAALGPWPHRALPVRRLGVSDEVARHGLELSWSELSKAARTLRAGPSDDQKTRAYQMIDWALELIQALDGPDAATRLLDLDHQFPELYGRAVTAAGALEARLGLLETGAVRAELEKTGASDPPHALDLALALAENGSPVGVEYVAALVSAGVTGSFGPPVYYQALAASGTEAAKAFFQSRLDDLRDDMEQTWDAARAGGDASPRMTTQQIVPYALVVLGEDDPGLFDGMPLPVGVLDRQTFPVLADPVQMFELMAGTVPGGPAQRYFYNWQAILGDQLCKAIVLRAPEEAIRILDGMAGTLQDATGNPSADSVALTTAAFTAPCHFSRVIAQQVAKNRPEAAEKAIFAPLGKTRWIRRPAALAAMGRTFRDMGVGLTTDGTADTFTPAELGAVIPEGDGDLEAYRQLFLTRVTLLSDAWTTRSDYPNGALRRVILRRVHGEGDYSGADLFAHLDAKPRIRDGRLQIGLRLRADIGVGNGLAMQISGELDRLKSAQADANRSLIRSVMLQRAGDVTEMTFAGTTKSGVHVFEAALPETGLADLSLHVNMALLQDAWTVDMPLYWSHFAFRQRLGARP